MTSIQLFKPLLKKRNNSLTQICKSVNSFSNIYFEKFEYFIGKWVYYIILQENRTDAVQARHVRAHAAAVRFLCLLRAQIRRAGQSPHAAFYAVTRRRTKGGRVSHLPSARLFGDELQKATPFRGNLMNGKEAIIRLPLLSLHQ